MRRLFINTIIVTGLLVFLALMVGCGNRSNIIDLSGNWTYRLDPEDMGIDQNWHTLAFNDHLILPGTLAKNDIGDEVSKETPWVGAIIDSALWFSEKYDRLADDDGYKVPFWLAPTKFYTGPAWYQKEVTIPRSWNGYEVFLHMERCHWKSMVWINDIYLGSSYSLSTPHQYKLPSGLNPGKHTITVRIDNSYVIPVGINAHSVSDNTQGNWNGIVGEINLVKRETLAIDDIKVFPDLNRGVVEVRATVRNTKGDPIDGVLFLKASSSNTANRHLVPRQRFNFKSELPEDVFTLEYAMGEDYLTWSEWEPSVYTLVADLRAKGSKEIKTVSFGMREISTHGTQFVLNGKKIFLRGTLECSIFPIEGHPPADYGAWERIFSIVKDWGLNHVRFHSWCPPRAAFEAADHLGIYLMPEAGAWATQGLHLGSGLPIDNFIMEEAQRIIDEYGNHPSFVLMSAGNEFDGPSASAYLDDFVIYFKNKDNRRLYTSAAGWPTAPSNQFFSTLQARVQQWTDQGTTYYIEDNPPTTNFNFNAYMPNYTGPFVSHEIGQWCAYPDFREIEQMNGVYKPGSLELIRAELKEKGMLHQAEDFLFASGRLQVLGYKADVEAALRTEEMGGFQLLDLHDFPGQGVALVGMLNSLWNEKGYISATEFRQFCDTTVLLTSINSLVMHSSDEFDAEIMVYHFGKAPLSAGKVGWQFINIHGEVVREGEITINELDNGSGQTIGHVGFVLNGLEAPAHYIFRLMLHGTSVENSWDIFIFPGISGNEEMTNSFHFTQSFGKTEKDILAKGGTVWLDASVILAPLVSIKAGFTPVYWNTLTFNAQPIHTMGVFVDPGHPLFDLFPTQEHTNWQWWDILTNSKAMIMDPMHNISPIVQMIDSYHSNRKLGLIAEGKYGGGKILISSIDFNTNMANRPASNQLKISIMNYLESSRFSPEYDIDFDYLITMEDKTSFKTTNSKFQ